MGPWSLEVNSPFWWLLDDGADEVGREQVEGVNWTRANLASIESQRVRTVSVLARPGTPSSQDVAPGEQADEDAFEHVRSARR